MADWRGEVDRWWAEVLRLPVAAMRAGGVFAADHLDHVGVVAVSEAAAPVVYGPVGTLPTLRAAVAEGGGDRLVQGRQLAAALGPRASRVLGPAWYGYVTAGTFVPVRSPAVRPLSEADLPLLARLHEQSSPPDREESGTNGLPAFGYIDGGALLAVACLGRRHGMPTIGVLTHPGARRRGLAGMVVAAAAEQGLNGGPVVQYRAWRRNNASVSVAARSGFAHYCDGLVIDLAS